MKQQITKRGWIEALGAVVLAALFAVLAFLPSYRNLNVSAQVAAVPCECGELSPYHTYNGAHLKIQIDLGGGNRTDLGYGIWFDSDFVLSWAAIAEKLGAEAKSKLNFEFFKIEKHFSDELITPESVLGTMTESDEWGLHFNFTMEQDGCYLAIIGGDLKNKNERTILVFDYLEDFRKLKSVHFVQSVGPVSGFLGTLIPPTGDTFIFDYWSLTCNLEKYKKETFEDNGLYRVFPITLPRIPSYSVKFLCCSEVLQNTEVPSSDWLTLPAEHSCSKGHDKLEKFMGWYCQTLGYVMDSSSVVSLRPTYDLVFVASWFPKMTEVIFFIDDVWFSSQQIMIGESATFPVATKEGYDFIEWRDFRGDAIASYTFREDIYVEFVNIYAFFVPAQSVVIGNNVNEETTSIKGIYNLSEQRYYFTVPIEYEPFGSYVALPLSYAKTNLKSTTTEGLYFVTASNSDSLYLTIDYRYTTYYVTFQLGESQGKWNFVTMTDVPHGTTVTVPDFPKNFGSAVRFRGLAFSNFPDILYSIEEINAMPVIHSSFNIRAIYDMPRFDFLFYVDYGFGGGDTLFEENTVDFFWMRFPKEIPKISKKTFLGWSLVRGDATKIVTDISTLSLQKTKFYAIFEGEKTVIEKIEDFAKDPFGWVEDVWNSFWTPIGRWFENIGLWFSKYWGVIVGIVLTVILGGFVIKIVKKVRKHHKKRRNK